MISSLYIWKLIAGISFFLLGMTFVEESLRKVSGRRFKLFLRHQTSSNIKAVAGGTFLTGIFQSSSVVNTMVLAFVGTGVLSMQRALAVVLGDNLGSTVDSWFFASAGFSFNIARIAYPCISIAGIALIFFNKNTKWHQWGRFVMGIGLLFLGLDMIKGGMMEFVTTIDLGNLTSQAPALFMLTGLIITALIQSSSATVVIVLSALYANLISLHAGMAIVLGAEVGTTLKFLLATINAIPAKRRVVAGNFLFNLITSLIILLFLHPVHYFIVDVLNIKSKLIALVFFQSFVNLAGILLFFPFLNSFTGFLERMFKKDIRETIFIHKVSPELGDLAIEAFKSECEYFLRYVIQLSMEIFNTGLPANKHLPQKFTALPALEKYDYIKQLHGEMLAYYLELQNKSTDKQDALRLDRLISTVRNSMYAAKSLKDAMPDIEMLRNSSNNVKYTFYLQACKKIEDFYNRLTGVIEGKTTASRLDVLTRIFNEIQNGYTDSLKELYKQSLLLHINEMEISSLINFNRQLYTAFKSMGLSLNDFYLTEKERTYFDTLPGFIH